MTSAHVQLRIASCLGHCALSNRHPAHHDRLLAVDTDAEALLELIELAVTWHELDYSESSVVGPEHWAGFVERHLWMRPERAERAFSLAQDILGRGGARAGAGGGLAEVIELVVG
jgi:hypothetical protein